jgi:hypothetical protein
MNCLHNSGFHIEYAWSGGSAVLYVERPLVEGACGKYGVVVPQNEHLWVTASGPVHVRTRPLIDEGWTRS